MSARVIRREIGKKIATETAVGPLATAGSRMLELGLLSIWGKGLEPVIPGVQRQTETEWQVGVVSEKKEEKKAPAKKEGGAKRLEGASDY